MKNINFEDCCKVNQNFSKKCSVIVPKKTKKNFKIML